MGMFFIYSIKVAICLAAFYLFYKLLLSRDTFHAFNRATLLLLMLLSLVLPFVNISVDEPTVAYDGMVQIEQLLAIGVVDDGPAPSGPTLIQVLFAIYIIGVALFLVGEICSLVRLHRLISGKNTVITADGIKIVVIDDDVAPFSWFNNIVISRSDYESGRREILIHEKAHIARRHSLDIMLCNMLLIFQWFNPAAWLLRREMQNIHEYEADEAVIKSGADASGYQLLLIRKAVGERLFSMANNLNHNSLKKRITMMLTKKSNPWNRAKILLTVPVAAVAVVAFATPKAESLSKEIEHDSNALVNSVVRSMPGTATPVAISQGEAVASGVQDEAVASEAVAADSLRGRVGSVAAADSKDGAPVFDVVEEQPQYPGGTNALMAYLRENIKYPAEAAKAGIEGRVIVQFVVGKDGTVRDIKPVKSVSQELDAEAVRVVAAMPKWVPGYQSGEAVNVRYTLPINFRADGGSKISIQAEASSNVAFSDDVYYVVDGVHVGAAELKKISADNIKSIEVFKDKSAVEKFGEQAKNGAIVVSTKK
ncbi:M56 family metallopeptidase [uncultured Prevotella sp.]|uniref:M56 family metallopeptidase n=1 Tax=uncultured Prevotella sp. TaxID=159272 RepID=UPI0026319588|nr:M56 family metallopeptidase [uncultured Prevotella sp.]